MASKTTTVTEYTDDLDGSKADGTVAFSYDGTNYEIDLSKKNATALAKVLKPYVDGGRKVRAGRARTTRTASARKTRSDLSDVRAWAAANGHTISDRGRVPSAVLEAYDAR